MCYRLTVGSGCNCVTNRNAKKQTSRVIHG